MKFYVVLYSIIQMLVSKPYSHIQHIGYYPSSRYLAYSYHMVDKAPPCLDVGVYREMVGWMFPQAYRKILGMVAFL